MRTALGNRLVASGSNVLVSSIVLACRPRAESASVATRRDFLIALRKELPEAVRVLQERDIWPVDMAQSAIGPGIKVFSRYARVLEADGTLMSVSAALTIINQILDEVLDGGGRERRIGCWIPIRSCEEDVWLWGCLIWTSSLCLLYTKRLLYTSLMIYSSNIWVGRLKVWCGNSFRRCQILISGNFVCDSRYCLATKRLPTKQKDSFICYAHNNLLLCFLTF